MVRNLPATQDTCRRCGFDPWVVKILSSGKWKPTPVFLSGKSRGQRSMTPVFGVANESDTTKQLNNNNNVFRVCHVIMTRLVHNSLIRTDTSILVAMIS